MEEVLLHYRAQLGSSIFVINAKMSLVLQKRDEKMDDKFKVSQTTCF